MSRFFKTVAMVRWVQSVRPGRPTQQPGARAYNPAKCSASRPDAFFIDIHHIFSS